MNFFLSNIVTIVLASIVFFTATQLQAQRRPVKRKVVRAHHANAVKKRRKANWRYAHLPRRGAVVKVTPSGAKVITYKGKKYWRNNGVYYVAAAGGYKVVRPARGIRVRVLPTGYRRIVVKGRPHFYYYGTFYQKVDNSEEYEVVDPPIGAVVDSLPEGYEIMQLDGGEYYAFDNVYYKEVSYPEYEDGIGYEVVKTK